MESKWYFMYTNPIRPISLAQFVYNESLWCPTYICMFDIYLHGDNPGVGGNGRTLSGGHRRVTITVAGSGIDVPPLPALAYGTGICLEK